VTVAFDYFGEPHRLRTEIGKRQGLFPSRRKWQSSVRVHSLFLESCCVKPFAAFVME
jgi:hypothetical protein